VLWGEDQVRDQLCVDCKGSTRGAGSLKSTAELPPLILPKPTPDSDGSAPSGETGPPRQAAVGECAPAQSGGVAICGHLALRGDSPPQDEKGEGISRL